ncbi:hypothetical protein DW841_12000 [Hungatella hathewayi]|nr:hypothetical protein DW841_12000 [Hungatella hathewayi]
MSNRSLFSLGFIIGAASGATVAWYLLKDKYETLAQEEIDSVKEVFARREQEMKDETVKRNVAEGIKDSDRTKPDLKEYAEQLKKNGYTRYSDLSADDEGVSDKQTKPYVIPPEQFGDDENYDQISLTYYADGVLADENDEVIDDVEEAVGIESLNHFGEYEDDSVFVRNDTRKCDYEILLDQRTYSEVAEEMPHRMEV